jgi:hypothetical protein
MTQCNLEAGTDVSEKTYRRVPVSQDTNPIQLLVLVSATRRMPQTFFNTKKKQLPSPVNSLLSHCTQSSFHLQLLEQPLPYEHNERYGMINIESGTIHHESHNFALIRRSESRHKKLQLLTDRAYAVAQLVEAIRYKPESRGFDSRWSHSNFSLT